MQSDAIALSAHPSKAPIVTNAPRLPASAKQKRPRAFEQVCDRIRAELAQGRIKPGDRLPAERDLAAQLKVSRAAVREALRSLEVSGLLQFELGVNGGAFVRQLSSDGLTRSLNDLLFLAKAPIAWLTEVRSALLSAAIRAACERATLGDLVDLDANIDQTERSYAQGDAEAAITAISDFYELLGKAAHNDILTLLIASLSGTVRELLHRTELQVLPEFVSARRLIVQSIRERDPDVASGRLQRHIDALEHYVASHPLPPGPAAGSGAQSPPIELRPAAPSAQAPSAQA